MSDPIYQLSIDLSKIALVYLVIALMILRILREGALRDVLFSVLNVCVFYVLFFHDSVATGTVGALIPLAKFAAYILFGIVHWLLIRNYVVGGKTGQLGYYMALLYPIIPLVILKIETAWHLVGFSYMAFRMAQAALELRKAKSESCNLFSYVGFLYFPFTIAVGPINPYLTYKHSLVHHAYDWEAAAMGLGRILVGFVKLRLLATIAFQMTFSNLWMDGFVHGHLDFLISSFAFFIYMYLNFSGACDIVIGASAILNIRVKENFDDPFKSANIRDFWNRWHISLSEFVRNLLFTPIYMNVTRVMGIRWALMASLLSSMVAFVVIGLWHGFQTGFLYFGLWHGVGFCIHILWDAALKKVPKSKRLALRRNVIYRFLSTGITLAFVSLSMIFVELPTAAQRSVVYQSHSGTW